MSLQTLIYEQPLNERIRSFLRLENLFSQLRHYVAGEHHWDTRQALTTLLEIMNVLERSDLKNEATKELERHLAILRPLAKNNHTDLQTLEQILTNIEGSLLDLQKTTRLAQPLLDNPFLASIRQRLTTPGGTCSFDLPAFHAWLHLPYGHRQAQLTAWINYLRPLEKGIQLSLDLLRKSTLSETVTAAGGRFETHFPGSPICQLIRLELPAHTGYFPEISGSKYCVHVRFMSTLEEQKPSVVMEDISFRLTCCAF